MSNHQNDNPENRPDAHAEGEGAPPTAGNVTTGGATGTPGKNLNPFLKVLVYLFAVPAVLINESTKKLFNKTYTGSVSSIVGVLLALGAGIGTGYHFGWTADVATWKWVGLGVSAAVLTFFYVWPLLYLSVFKFAFKSSEKLWSHVNIEAKEHYRRSYREEENVKTNPAWFSKFLMFIGYATLAVGGLMIAWNVAGHVAATQATWGWVGTVLGIASVIVFAIISIAIFFGIASLFRSGGFAFTCFVIACIVGFFFWGAISSAYLWAYHGLTASPWTSFWGHVAGLLPGVIAGGAISLILGAILYHARIRAIAVVTGAIATYYVADSTAAFVSSVPLGMFEIVSPTLKYLAYGLEMLLFVGFVFPLAHIAISHGLRKLANILDLMEAAYDEERGGYREFFTQVLNIGVATKLALSTSAGLALAGFALPFWAVVLAAFAVGFASYTLIGKLFNFTGAWPAGVATAGAAAVYAFGLSSGVMAYVFGALAAVVTFVVLFPLAYLAVRFLIQGWLGAWLRNPLVNAHKRACGLVGELFDNLFHAAELTYGDESKFKPTFLHLVNLAALVGVVWGGWVALTGVIGFATWLAVSTLVVASVLSYLLIGKLFQKAGNPFVGVLAGIAGGIYVGAWAYASQPWGLIVAIIVGLVAAALTFGLVFPVAYVVLKAVLNVISQETWLNPLLTGAHDRAWARFTSIWDDFVIAYKNVRDSLSGITTSIKKQVDEITASVKQMFNKGDK